MAMYAAFASHRPYDGTLLSLTMGPPGAALDPHEALRRAVESLTGGHFDNRDVAGAQANALESIAWSLIGLLRRTEQPGERPSRSDREELVADILERLDMVRAER